MIRSAIFPSTSMRLNFKELQQRYESGQRNFEQVTLTGVNLKGADLRYINLKGADLSNADLSEAILYGANLENTNLNCIKLNEAKLQGAFLAHATIVCGHLSNANLRDADLRHASLDATTLKGTILEGADLRGTYLVGADLEPTNLSKVYFDHNTHLPDNCNFINQETLLEAKISVEDLLQKFNYLTQYGSRYLGPMMTAKNWQSSRPESPCLNRFIVNASGQITFSGVAGMNVKNSQRHFAQQWMINFINHCSNIFREFPYLIDHEKIIF
ncbi:pentapeptide repeat protein [Stanieria cyanosphaera PCC 7437]|uniref:Pentapeptide repeat protein n=1 Tax=Stanieria cyanosphaera (strain ATCC 29371 / PCC 7437) TaxID=111780 RepID=K9XTY1_STAC7|nr:pentapeptide repeat-containing protein [Stanieria cyanosphaera]AFZ35524.1 pentapeptide repeat protein [Stanieria cyanosphaera PCC 7437]